MWGRRRNKKNKEREGNREDSYQEKRTEKGNKRDNTKKTAKVKFKKIIFVTMIIVLGIVIIACPAIVPVIFTFKNVKCPIAATEASLLATGIAIIGAAITVWTGLNIANSINRKELENIEKKARKIKRKISKKFIQLEENTDTHLAELEKDTGKQLNQLKKDSEDIKKSVEYSLINNYNVLFLQELLKTVMDTCSLYFYKEFNVFFSEQKYDTVKSRVLMEIEQCFVEIYNLHKNKPKEYELMISKADFGLEKIKEYELNEKTEGLVKQYLNYRRGEINYYKGYCEDNPSEVYECFMEAIERYIDFANQIDIPLVFNQQKDDEFMDYNETFLEMACYLAGSVGDSYSGIVEECRTQARFRTKRGYITKKQIIECAQNAIYFCGCAVKWSKNTSYENEVYFRNLGVAYERLDRINETIFKHKKEIMNNYKYAFQIMYNDSDLYEERKQNIYHTILSYYERIFKHDFSEFDNGCLKYTSAKRESVLKNAEELDEYRDEITKMISKIKEQGNDAIDAELLHEYVTIARSGVEHNPHYTLRISLLGLAYTYVIFLLKADNASARQVFLKPVEYYMAEIEKLISYLDIVEWDDDYANELQLRYKGIMEI